MRKLMMFLLVPTLAHAEPGRVTQYLAGERATLLDVGMMRLEALTDEFENRVGLFWTDHGEARPFQADISASYEPGGDKIYVSFAVADNRPTDEQMAEGCEQAMGQMNIWLLKSLPGLFLHSGGGSADVPNDVMNALPDMFELRCRFSSEQSSSEGRFWARRTLGALGSYEMQVGPWSTN
jgi:hypothetical protein